MLSDGQEEEDVQEEEDAGPAPLTRAGLPYPPRVPWEELRADFLEAWGRPGGQYMPEHLEIMGSTGSGKSWFERDILLERARLRGSHVVIVATKPADATLTGMGWPIVTSWPPSQYKKGHERVIFWVKASGISRDATERQRAQIAHFLDYQWRPDANFVIVFDEIAYLQHELQLEHELRTYYREGRGLGITIVATTQRSQGVTRWMHSESAWTVLFGTKDQDDKERMAQVAGNKAHYLDVLDDLDLDKREFVIIHNRTKRAFISHIPPHPAGGPNNARNNAGNSRPNSRREPGTHRRDRTV